jgi:hypothetical protein
MRRKSCLFVDDGVGVLLDKLKMVLETEHGVIIFATFET